MPNRMSVRRGFTLIELLVVIAIISLLMALLLPAIQRVREAANRMLCASNLRQLTIACHNYANDYGGFPFNAITKNNNQFPWIPYTPGTIPTNPGQPGGTQGRCSVLVTILPYIEQDNLGKQYFYNVDWSDPLNVNNLKVKTKVYRCPSSATSDENVVAYKSNYIGPGNNAFAPPNGSGASTNILGGPVYPTINNSAGSTGWSSDYASLCQVKTKKDAAGLEIAPSNPLLLTAYPSIAPSKGAMKQNAITKIAHVYDGTTNTTLFSEASGRDLQYYAGKVSQPYDATKATGMIWADSDNRLTVTGTDSTGLLTIGSGPCVMNTNNLQGDIYSFHTHGANVAFADGSVRFLKEDISIVTLAAIVTAKGGETFVLDD